MTRKVDRLSSFKETKGPRSLLCSLRKVSVSRCAHVDGLIAVNFGGDTDVSLFTPL